MPYCRHIARLLSRITLMAVLVLAAGCVSSRQAAYERHLTARVAAGSAADDEVAAAFGLDAYATRVATRSPSATAEN
jgi:hypothetical protein